VIPLAHNLVRYRHALNQLDGANRGLGVALFHALHRDGARVLGLARVINGSCAGISSGR
jgi:hypothetical protein